MDRVVNDDTRLLYVTTGVLLQKLINTKNMQQYTHVILDEASTICDITYIQSEILAKIYDISEIWLVHYTHTILDETSTSSNITYIHSKILGDISEIWLMHLQCEVLYKFYFGW